jgi:hypothetical protein
MATKVFVSWSGSLSKKVAEVFRDWIQNVLQNAQPFLSSEDIDKGGQWWIAINDELASSGVGVVCLTSENLDARWLLFESGALAKGLQQARICTLLINVKAEQVTPPLSMFQATLPTKADMFRLVKTINVALGEKGLTETRLEQSFSHWWGAFEKNFTEALESEKHVTKLPKRSNEEMLAEILEICRSLQRNANAQRPPTTLQELLEQTGGKLGDVTVRRGSDFTKQPAQARALSEMYYSTPPSNKEDQQ